MLLTDVAGVMDKKGELIPELSAGQVRRLMEDGTISGGMIPKLETCVAAVQKGVEAAVILDLFFNDLVMIEIFTERGVGTIIRGE